MFESRQMHTGVQRLAPRGMISLRGDFADPAIRDAVFDVAGVRFPDTRQIVMSGDQALGWMSPDEVLFLCAREDVADGLARLAAGLAGIHHLAVDVSDARCLFEIRGPHAREVLAKGAPVDLHPARFAPGEIRRTRLGQVAVAFWMPDEDVFELVCFRSVSGFVEEWLQHAARPGSMPEYFSG